VKSWIALGMALVAGGGIGWFIGYGMGRKSGAKDAYARVAFDQSGEIDQGGMFGGNQSGVTK
jgi:hypothetical protein